MEIAPGIHSLGQWRGGHVHAFLLDDDGALTLIDTLFDIDAHRVLSAKPARPQADRPQSILLSHGHRSHLGGLAALKRLSGATVYAHTGRPTSSPASARRNRCRSPDAPVHLVYLPTYPFQLGARRSARARTRRARSTTSSADGDRVGPVEVLHAPGHSPGHLAFHWPERRALFAGDAVVTWPEFAAGWPAFTLNVTQHCASLRRMADLDAEIVAVGHGEPIVQGAAQQLQTLAQAAA